MMAANSAPNGPFHSYSFVTRDSWHRAAERQNAAAAAALSDGELRETIIAVAACRRGLFGGYLASACFR
jgi:hypothetical protein